MATRETDGTDETSAAGMVVMPAAEAMRAMQAGKVPARLRAAGDLHFYRQDKVAPPRALPPDELVAERIIIHDASQLAGWPRVVRCYELYLWHFQHDFAPDALLDISAPADAPWGVREVYLFDCPRLTHLPDVQAESLRELHVNACPLLDALPAGLRVTWLRLESCSRLESLPADLEVTTLEVADCPALRVLPPELHASSVSLTGCAGLTELPAGFSAGATLNLADCAGLTRVPDDVEALRLNISGCRGLTALPARLRSLYINMDGCANIARWDDPEVTVLRQLSARGCAGLESLPPNLRQVDELDVQGCERLTSLPEGLRVTRWVDVGESGVRGLPASAQGVQVRWNGVNVTGQVAFHPETLSARRILSEENAELRRVMLERIGPERFMAEARPQQLDADMDAGGVRRLLSVEIAGDEPLVALQVRDPSTGRLYLLRVPPEMDTCRRAAAWIAGFDDPADYQPVMET